MIVNGGNVLWSSGCKAPSKIGRIGYTSPLYGESIAFASDSLVSGFHERSVAVRPLKTIE